MRILIGAETYSPDVNGASRFTARLAAGLAGRGHDVHVVCPSPEGPAYRRHENGVTEHRVRSHRYPMHPGFRVCMPWEAGPDTARVLAAVDPDVVHVQSHHVVGRGLAAAAHRTGRPLVATNHFMPENLADHTPIPRVLMRVASRWAWRDLARVFRKADAVTAPTPRAVELLATSAGLSEAIAVSCGIDLARYEAAGRTVPTPEVPSVLFVGRLDQEKHVDELVRAFAMLPDGVPAELEIVGDGAKRAELSALAERLGVAARIRFRGFVTEDELLDSYARAAVFCMPGVAELQSLATMEAMAAGTPVVAADAMALPHLVRPGRNGWLYTPGDVPELSARLGALLGDVDLRVRMGTASQEIVAHHAIGATLSAFENIYRRVLARPAITHQRAA